MDTLDNVYIERARDASKMGEKYRNMADFTWFQSGKAWLALKNRYARIRVSVAGAGSVEFIGFAGFWNEKKFKKSEKTSWKPIAFLQQVLYNVNVVCLGMKW